MRQPVPLARYRHGEDRRARVVCGNTDRSGVRTGRYRHVDDPGRPVTVARDDRGVHPEDEIPVRQGDGTKTQRIMRTHIHDLHGKRVRCAHFHFAEIKRSGLDEKDRRRGGICRVPRPEYTGPGRPDEQIALRVAEQRKDRRCGETPVHDDPRFSRIARHKNAGPRSCVEDIPAGIECD